MREYNGFSAGTEGIKLHVKNEPDVIVNMHDFTNHFLWWCETFLQDFSLFDKRCILFELEELK